MSSIPDKINKILNTHSYLKTLTETKVNNDVLIIKLQ